MIFYVTIITIFFGFCVYYFRQNKTKVPPGMKTLPIEKGLPVIGILKDIKGPLSNYLTKISKKHGGMYLVKFGMRDVLVLNNFECMKAAFVDNGETFSGRWHQNKCLFMSDGYGIITIDGELWSEQRSYLLKTLKDFGLGRSRSVEMVQDECVYMLKDLDELDSKTIDFFAFISLYTANVISKFIMSKRFTHEDPELKIIEETTRVVVNKKSSLRNLSIMFPILDRNEWLIKFLLWITSRKLVIENSLRIFQKEIEKRLLTLDLHSDGEDLIERFLIKQHQVKEKDGSTGSFTQMQLIISAYELFIAGYDTTSSTLTWSFMFMAMYPDIQKKVYEEISDQIGTERLPTMSDKPSLVYTQAVMDEIMRLGTVTPLGILHRTRKSTCVNGFFIPKDTLVIPNILACHLDPTIWEKPMEFYPAHFLSTDLKGDIIYNPRVELVPFSMGKRQCLGESLARMEYFIFFTGVLQRFQVSLPDVNTSFDVLRAGDGTVRKPNCKDFIFKKRN